MTDQPSPADRDCPSCGKQKWAAVVPSTGGDPTDLRCMECGFQVDYRVVLHEAWILMQNAREVELPESMADESGP